MAQQNQQRRSTYIDPQPALDRVRFIPLGGLDEVGRNMSVVEYGEDLIIVDLGMGFPEEEMLGVDLVLPDVSYLQGKEKRIRGIVITHAHEDHIGGIPYLLPQLQAGREPIPVYGTEITLGFIQNKLRERNVEADMRVVRAGDVIELGEIRVEMVHICHTIPDACLLGIHTPVGTVVHTGDFKFDVTPVDDWLADYQTLMRLGDEGVLGLFTDCINVNRPGQSPSEREAGRTIDGIVRDARGRVILATFASLIPRIQQVLDVAYKYGRKVALIGRSLINNVQVASDLGYLRIPDNVLIEVGETSKLHDSEVLVICTGSQGEPTSALSRIANDDSRYWSVKPGDTYILSATPIPGNQPSVARVINNLFKKGAEVIDYESSEARVHVSGHAYRDEHKLMLNMLRPRYVVPIHGERRHLAGYAKLAEQVGIPRDNILLVENGSVVEMNEESAQIVGIVPAGDILVDGASVGAVGEVVLRDRQHLARDGILLVVVTLDRQSGQLVAGPDIVTRGFVYVAEAGELLDNTKERVRNALRHEDGATMPEWNYLNKKIRDTVSQYLYEQTRMRPMVLPVVMEL